MPTIHGIYWLKRNAKTDRKLQLVKWLSYLLPIFVVVVMAYSYFALGFNKLDELPPEKLEKIQLQRDDLKKSILILLVIMGGLPFIVAPGLNNLRRKLGTDGYRIYVRLTDGQQISFAPEQAIYGARLILYKDLAVAVLTTNQLPLYEKGEVQTYIAPLLKNAQKRSTLAIVRYGLAHPDRATIFVIIYTALVIGLFIYTGLWEKMFFPKR